jgi:hypothetical protein
VNSGRGKPGLLLALFLVLLAGLAFGIHTLTENNTPGSDFYVFWQAGRGFLLEHQSPYSEAFAQRSQLAVMKRLASPEEDQLGFAYPPFSILILLPLLWLPFDWAAAIWQAFLIASLLTAILLSAQRKSAWLAWLLLTFYPVFFGVILGNFAVLLGALLLLLGQYLFEPDPDPKLQVLAGVATAWLLVKPQFTWFYVVILVLYAFVRRIPPAQVLQDPKNLHREDAKNAKRDKSKRENAVFHNKIDSCSFFSSSLRSLRLCGARFFHLSYFNRGGQRWFLGGFFGSAAFFGIVSFVIWPGWVGEWLAELGRYSVYNRTLPTLTILLQDWLPVPVALIGSGILLAGCLVLSARKLWQWWQGRFETLPLLAWAGLVILLIHPHGKSYEHIAFLFPLALWLCRHPRPFSLPVVAWWLGSWIVSWAAFLLAGSLQAPGWAVSDWPVWVYAVWVLMRLREEDALAKAQRREEKKNKP